MKPLLSLYDSHLHVVKEVIRNDSSADELARIGEIRNA
jgi:hypothetical protein